MARRFRIRLRRKNKCIRWKKGTCSSTNPPVTTHRSVAPSICPSLLDDGTLLSEGISTNFGDNDLLSCSTTAVPDNATICTNATFNHVGNHQKIAEENKLINDEIINVLSGVTEVLRSDQSPLQEESDTAYFACLMTTLETAEQSELTTTAILYLLSVVIKKVDANVLQKEFDHINTVFMDVLRKYESTNETLLLRSWMKSYAWLLKCQQKENLKSESIMLILKFCNDSRHRVRKSCHGCLESILKSLTTNTVAVHPLTNTVYNYCTTNLEPYALNNDLLTSALISMYRSIIPFVSSENILCVCEYLLKLMPLRSQVIRNQCFQAMHTLFKSDYSHLDSDTNCKLINALYAYQPKNIEVTPLCTWIEVITFAHIRLFRLSIKYGWLHLPKLVNVSVKTLLCENVQICEAVNNSIQLQICNCIGKTIESQQIDKDAFLRYIQEFVNGFNSKFRIVWKFIFARFADLVEIMPVEYFCSIQKYISLVGQMRPNHNSLPNENETRKLIDLIICNSVKIFGPENVISAIPLTFNSVSCQFEPQWLVDIFKSSIENTSLMFFIKFFLPYAIKTQTSNDDKIQAECDIWSLFPAFCRSPTDSHVFPSISKGIGISMVKYAYLQPIILRGLLNLLKSSQKDKVLLKAVRKDAKNFLPILLNIYVGSLNRQDIHNLSYNTIYQLCKIIDCKLNEVYFTNLMQKVDTAQKKATRTLLLELLPCFISKLSAEWRLKLYDISLELIDVSFFIVSLEFTSLEFKC
ncbi:hypothetical protein GJ496_006099 [Pomphorhynchus laevis]|nr:hypothetical protein GJ496_006099 [Pomphorhynchus laevis]